MTTTTTPRAGQSSRTAAESILRNELLRALREPSPTARVLLIADVMQKLSAENWRGMLAAFADEKLQGREHGDVRLLLVQRAGEMAGADAVKYFLSGDDPDATRAALTGWAIRNPAAALEWLGKDITPETRRQYIGAAIRGLALTEPDLAVAELESIPIDRRKNYTNRFVDSLVRARGLDETEALVGGMIKRAAAANNLDDDYLGNVFWDLAQAKIQQAQTTGDIPGLAAWLRQYVGQPFVNPSLVGAVVERYVAADPLKAFQWLDSYNRENFAAGAKSTVGYDMLMAAWTQRDGIEPVGQWLAQMTAHPDYDRMAHRYSQVVAASDPDTAMRWASTIKTPSIKSAAIDYIKIKSATIDYLKAVNKPKG